MTPPDTAAARAGALTDLAARLEVLADGLEAMTGRLGRTLRADPDGRWCGPHRRRVEAELGGHARSHRRLAVDLRDTAAAARRRARSLSGGG